MAYLDQQEKANVGCVEELKCDVARPVSGVPFPLADKRYTLCNVAHDGWSKFDGLAEISVSVSV